MHDPSPIRPDALLTEADWLHRLARAMLRDEDRAHDVAQETLVVALGKTRAPVANLRAWLLAIARRLEARGRRTELRRVRHEQSVVRPDGDEREAETAERLHLHRRLCEAVLELPEPYRTAVSLRFFDDLPPRSIARQTGASAAVVRQRVHRGLTMLRERFDREAGDRAAWTRAFAAAGFGASTSSPPVLLPLLLMKKTLVAVALLVVVGAWWWGASTGWWQSAAPPAEAASAVAANTTAGAPGGTAAAEPASMRTAVADVFTVRAVDAQDRLVEGASVHRWRADGEIEVVRTNENGVAEFAPRPEAGGVLVQGLGMQTVVQAVPSLRGEVVVRLGIGRVVAGRVFEDGAPAPAGLQLKLSVPPRRDDLPDAPDAILDLLRSSTGQLTTATDGSGGFTFAGLQDSWAGELQVPHTHWLLRQSGQLVGDDWRLLVLAPDSGLRVETTRLPTVRGRVEWNDGSGPVELAFVLLGRIAFADGTVAPSLGEQTDAQGRFALGLYPGAPDQRERWLDPRRRSEPTCIQISVSRGSSANLTLEAGGGPLDLRSEVVVRLDRPAVQRFRAVDEAGNPLAGARALQGDGTLGDPTGVDGLGASCNPFGLWVGAPGRQVVEIRYENIGQGLGPEPHEVVLVQGNSLCVRVQTPTGNPMVANVVALTSKRPGLFRACADLRRWLGESPNEFLGNAFQFDRRGEARIVSLEPGEPCRLVVRDHFGGELAAQGIMTPALGEHRVIDITLTAAPHSVRGRVLDASGAPVALANVALRARGVDRSERTAADGSFRFAPMHTPGDLVLAVHRQGFAATERVFVTLGELEQELAITLSPARRTTVRIVDEDGVPVTETHLLVDTGTSRLVDQQQIGTGEYACLDLPPGEVTFACWIAGKRCELRHDTAKPSAELRVPRTARARFERPAGLQPSSSGRRLIAVARRLDATAEPLLLELDDDARGVPQLLSPGRYRIELSEMWWNYQEKRTDTEPLGPAAEVDLRLGEVALVTFR